MVEIEITVRYAETDRMGSAHHSNYFVWFEAVRTELIKRWVSAIHRLKMSLEYIYHL